MTLIILIHEVIKLLKANVFKKIPLLILTNQNKAMC